MKTIKVIDLLNKIANEELEDETKIKYDDDYFKYLKRIKSFNRYTNSFFETVEYYNDELFTLVDLNDEVEIIEEPQEHKIPEKLNISNFPRHNNSLKKTAIKINEILDYLEEIEWIKN